MSFLSNIGRVFGMSAERKPEATLFIQYTERDGSRRVLTRSQALKFVAFARCVDLLSSYIAEMISETVHVVDERTGLPIKNYTADKATTLLRESPDGIQVGLFWLRDLATDYLMTGNALVHVERMVEPGVGRPVPIRLTRLISQGAQAEITDESRGMSSIVYRARTPIKSEVELYPVRQVAHIRWTGLPQLHTSNIDGGGNARRLLFSDSPLEHLSPTLITGLNANAWIQSFFDDAAKNDQAISFPTDMDSDTQKKFMHHFGESQKDKRRPLILFGGASVTSLKPNPQSADVAKLREQSTEEVGRFYGVPAPLLNQHFTQWGSGIEQLARIFWRWGAKPHLKSVLAGLSFRILPPHQRFAVDPTAEVRGDTAAMSAFVAAVKPNTNSPALMSREETRKVIGAVGEFKDDWGWSPGSDPVDKSDEETDNARRIDELLGGSND